MEGVPAVDFGNEGEPIARDFFAAITEYEVMKCGLVTRDKHCFLGASPDSFIWSKNRPGFGVLEIKCKHSYVDPVILPLHDVPCLDDNNEKLKDKHEWYYQIQIQAWVCNANYAILFLFTGFDYKIIEVPIAHTWV